MLRFLIGFLINVALLAALLVFGWPSVEDIRYNVDVEDYIQAKGP